MSPGDGGIKPLIGVSIPRSGHHFLARLLQEVLGDGLYYCESYGNAGCCRTLPCKPPSGARGSLRKSHDFGLDLPQDLAGVVYLVQVRSPVPEAISDRELLVGRRVSDPRDDPRQYLHWLFEKAQYFVGFHRRWVRTDRPDFLVLDYDRLCADPAGAVARVLAAAGFEVDRPRIGAAVAAKAGLRWSAPDRPGWASAPATEAFRPRRPEESRFFDPGLLAQYESLLIDQLPDLEPQRTLARVEWRDGLLGHLWEAKRLRESGALAAALSLLREVAGRWPDDPYLALALAAGPTEGRQAEVRDALHRAMALAPANPDLLVAAANGLHDLGDADAACCAAARLAETNPGVASHQVFAAVHLARAGRLAEAVEAIGRALRHPFSEPHLWAAAQGVIRSAVLGGIEVRLTAGSPAKAEAV